jgi:hypothetical protein
MQAPGGSSASKRAHAFDFMDEEDGSISSSSGSEAEEVEPEQISVSEGFDDDEDNMDYELNGGAEGRTASSFPGSDRYLGHEATGCMTEHILMMMDAAPSLPIRRGAGSIKNFFNPLHVAADGARGGDGGEVPPGASQYDDPSYIPYQGVVHMEKWRDVLWKIAEALRNDPTNLDSIAKNVEEIESIGIEIDDVVNGDIPFNLDEPMVVELSDEEDFMSEEEEDDDINDLMDPESFLQNNPLSKKMATAYDVWERFYGLSRERHYTRDEQAFRMRESKRYQAKGVMQLIPDSALMYVRNQGFMLGGEQGCFLCDCLDSHHDGIDPSALAHLHKMMWENVARMKPFALAKNMHLYYMNKIFVHNQDYQVLTIEECYLHIVKNHTLDPEMFLPRIIRRQEALLSQLVASMFSSETQLPDPKIANAHAKHLSGLLALRKMKPQEMNYYNVSAVGDPAASVKPTNMSTVTSRVTKAAKPVKLYSLGWK